jgi:hypothetical protein
MSCRAVISSSYEGMKRRMQVKVEKVRLRRLETKSVDVGFTVSQRQLTRSQNSAKLVWEATESAQLS